MTLSAQGIFSGFHFADGSLIDFPYGLPALFDFRVAPADSTVYQLLLSRNSDAAYLYQVGETRGGLAAEDLASAY